MADVPINSQPNVTLRHLPKLQLRDAGSRFSCSLLPFPCQFWEFWKRDVELMAASYPPENIDWRIGEFNGDLGFYCDKKEIAAAGLSQQEFVSRARVLLENARESKNCNEFVQQYSTPYQNQNGGVFDDYVRDCHARVAKADELFSQIRITPEHIIDTIRNFGAPVLEQYREIIRSQAEELASIGLDVTERWVHAKELLGPGGFSRPPEQRYSHLRELIRKLEEQRGLEGRGETDLQVKYDQIQVTLKEERQRRQKLKRALSWRVTKPLRWLKCFLCRNGSKRPIKS